MKVLKCSWKFREKVDLKLVIQKDLTDEVKIRWSIEGWIEF